MTELSLKDRLELGNLSVPELLVLANTSRTKFYADVAAGRVLVEKRGAKTVIRGPIAKRYIAGLPLPAREAEFA